ncbi:MAG: PAS domain-containing sensor histidine kinase [Candidatus Kapabacteria bacterium]|nr:PAS domain-containing sensor histidine kinase [Candidatus Kapabacteria bacterium]
MSRDFIYFGLLTQEAPVQSTQHVLPLTDLSRARQLLDEKVIEKFGTWDTIPSNEMKMFLYDLKNTFIQELPKVGIDQPHGRQIATASDSTRQSLVQSDAAWLTVRNLQNLVIKLHRRDDGEIVYDLREGKLAGDFTTKEVFGKTPLELFGEDVARITMPNVERAFAGETVQFEYELNGKNFLTLLEPVQRDGMRVSDVVGSMIDITDQKQTEYKLRHNEQLFRMLIESMPVGVMKQEVRNDDGTVHDEVMNAEFLRITGYSADELIAMDGEARAALFHPDDLADIMKQWYEWGISTTESVLHLQYRYKHRAGNYRWLDNYLVKYPSKDSTREIVLQVVLDITSRIESEQHLRHLASYLQQSVKPIFEVKESGIITFLNPAADRAFPDLYERKFEHPVLQQFADVMDAIRDSPDNVHKRMLDIGDEYYEQHIYYMPEADVYRVFCHDITTMKIAENDLRDALDKERTVNMMRSRFITTISHEFRTPLTGISTSTALLTRYNETMKPEQRIQQLESIGSRVQELVKLIEDFTSQSSVRSLRDHFAPVIMDINNLCRSVIEEARSFAIDHKQKLEFVLPQEHLYVNGDEKLLRHAIRNLLMNAIRYSHTNSTVAIRLERLEKAVVITVTDNGIGVPEGERQYLFTPFFRANNVGKIPGSGLGLSITKEFVELHHGLVGVEANPTGGTIATIHLPMAAELR